jgi:tetratricopeptide (TPR) repeat protein
MARKRKVTEEDIKADLLYEARELAFEAYEAETKAERRELATKALLLSPDCADAYLILAEHAKNYVDALPLVLAAVYAGERAIGAKDFKEMQGHFWGYIDTRPYMRALAELGRVYMNLGDNGQSIACYQKMLRLNPNDNQGMRDVLMPLLIIENKLEDAETLYSNYKENIFASWLYSRALLDFLKFGDNPESKASLAKAVKQNKFVAEALKGKLKLPTPTAYTIGSKEEAALYLEFSLPAWKNSYGALKWLKSVYP